MKSPAFADLRIPTHSESLQERSRGFHSLSRSGDMSGVHAGGIAYLELLGVMLLGDESHYLNHLEFAGRLSTVWLLH